MQGMAAIHDLWCQARGCWLLIGDRRSIGFEAQSQLAQSPLYIFYRFLNLERALKGDGRGYDACSILALHEHALCERL